MKVVIITIAALTLICRTFAVEMPPVMEADQWKLKYPEKYRPKSKPADPEEQYRENGEIKYLTIHHALVTPKNKTPDAEITTIGDAVWKHHVNAKGFQDVAYHYLIGQSGQIYKGRPDNIAPASGEFYFAPEDFLKGKYSQNGSLELAKPDGAKEPGNNQGHVTICFLVAEKMPSKEAQEAAIRLAAALMQTYKIPLEHVKVHREVAKTTCPGDAIHAWLRGPLSSEAYKQEGPGLTAIRGLLPPGHPAH